MAIKKCRECGEAVSTEAKGCPKCGVSHPTETGMDRLIGGAMKVAIGVIIGDFIFGWGLIFSLHRPLIPPIGQPTVSNTAPTAQIQPHPPSTPASIIDKTSYSFEDLRGILDVYSDNQALFYSSFKGKRMHAKAPYKALSKSMFSDDEYSLLAGDRLFQDIRCSVPAKTATTQLASLNKGDTVIVTGAISDVFLGTLVLTPCVVERL